MNPLIPDRLADLRGDLPRSEGVHQGVGPSAQELNSLPPIEVINTAHSLIELQTEFTFFTHALLFTEGLCQHDPVEEWMLTNDQTKAVTALEFNSSVFRGLEKSEIGGHYNRLLMMCRHETWAKLFPILNTLVLVDVFQKRYVSGFVNDVIAPDPKTWHGGYPPQILNIKAVGISATDGLWYIDSYHGFLPPPFGWLGSKTKQRPAMQPDTEYLPKVVKDVPEKKVLDMAAILFPVKT